MALCKARNDLTLQLWFPTARILPFSFHHIYSFWFACNTDLPRLTRWQIDLGRDKIVIIYLDRAQYYMTGILNCFQNNKFLQMPDTDCYNFGNGSDNHRHSFESMNDKNPSFPATINCNSQIKYVWIFWKRNLNIRRLFERFLCIWLEIRKVHILSKQKLKCCCYSGVVA